MQTSFDRPTSLRSAFKQMNRETARHICDDYLELVVRLKRLADNLAGAFVVASGNNALALEVELRTIEEAIDVVSGSLLTEVIDDSRKSLQC